MPELLRSRLLDRLDGELAVVVAGLPGVGKSTLLRQWAAQPTDPDECRVLVDVARQPLDRPALVNLTVAALADRGIELDEAELRESAELALAGALSRFAGRLQIAFNGVDRLVAGLIVGLVMGWRQQEIAVRAIFATADPTRLVAVMVGAGMTHRVIGQDAMRLDRPELEQFVRETLPGISDHALDRLMKVGDAVIGVVAGLVRHHPHDVLNGTVTRAQAMAQIWVDEIDGEPLPFDRFLLDTIVAPRFTVGEMRSLTTCEDAMSQLRRAVELDLGVLRPSRWSAEPTFVWDAAVRDRALEILAARRTDAEQSRDQARVAEVARSRGDHELQVLGLVGSGDLEQAAAVARERLWELIDTEDPQWWTPLIRVPVAKLMDFPALACLRMVLRFQLGHRLAMSGLVHGLAERHSEFTGSDPADRVHRHATALYVAVKYGELDVAEDAVRQGMRYVETLVDLELGAGSVSDLLLVAEAMLRLDRFDDTAAVAERVLIAIEAGSADVDPTGRRHAHAELLIEACARHLGHPVALARGAAPVETDRDRRETDVVATAVLRGWEALDDGDSATALDHTRAAMEAVDPVDWPLLLVVHLLAAVGAGRTDEVERVWVRYLKGEPWRSRQFTESRTGVSARELDALCARVLTVRLPERQDAPARKERHVSLRGPFNSLGSPLPLNERLTNEDPVAHLETLNPRSRQMALLLETTRATRAGEMDRALAALHRAVDSVPGSGLVPVLLATARPSDLDSLRVHAATQSGPDAQRITALLEAVVPIGRPRHEAPELSQREFEVLARIRAGRTNREIAEDLFVTVNTVKFHRANLMRKFEVDSRDRLLAAAHRVGL